MKNLKSLLLPAALALLAVSSATAQTIEYIIVGKEQYYTQTTTAGGFTATQYRFEAAVEGTSDLSGLTAPTLNSIPATSTGSTGAFVIDPDDNKRWLFQRNYVNGTLLENAYKPGDFNLTVLGESVTVGVPDETPRFTAIPKATLSGGNIVGGVLIWDVSQSLTISVADLGIPSTAGIDHISLGIYGTGIDRSVEAFGNATQSITIGGAGLNNTFIAGQNYHVEIDFVNIIGGSTLSTISGGALDGIDYAGIYSRTTSFTIQAVPEPATYAALAGLGALGLAAWRRRRAAV